MDPYQRIVGAVAFTYGVVEIADPDPDAHPMDTVEVAALFLGSQVIWKAPSTQCRPVWDDDDVIDEVADGIREVFNQTKGAQ